MRTGFTFILVAACLGLCSQNAWLPLNSGTQKDLYDLSFPTPLTGYVAGDSTIVKTSDGGLTWTSAFSTPLQNFNSIFFPSVSTGYVSSEKAVYRTFNGGGTWQQVHVDTVDYIRVVYYVND